MIIITSSLISAQLEQIENKIPEQVKSLENKVENIQEGVEQITKGETSNEYLRRSWEEMLNKSTAGKTLIKISNAVKKINPFFKLVLGIEYALSWQFFFASAIWLIIFFILIPATETIFKNKLFSIVSSFAITSIIGISGIIKKSTDLISKTLNSPWLVILLFILLISLIVIAVKSSKFWKGLRKKEEKRQEEKDRQIIHTEAESIKEQIKKDKPKKD